MAACEINSAALFSLFNVAEYYPNSSQRWLKQSHNFFFWVNSFVLHS